MEAFEKIENPPEDTLVQYLGVYVTRWRQEWGEPTVGFVTSESMNLSLRTLALLDEWLERHTCLSKDVGAPNSYARGRNDAFREVRALLRDSCALTETIDNGA